MDKKLLQNSLGIFDAKISELIGQLLIEHNSREINDGVGKINKLKDSPKTKCRTLDETELRRKLQRESRGLAYLHFYNKTVKELKGEYPLLKSTLISLLSLYLDDVIHLTKLERKHFKTNLGRLLLMLVDQKYSDATAIAHEIFKAKIEETIYKEVIKSVESVLEKTEEAQKLRDKKRTLDDFKMLPSQEVHQKLIQYFLLSDEEIFSPDSSSLKDGEEEEEPYPVCSYPSLSFESDDEDQCERILDKINSYCNSPCEEGTLLSSTPKFVIPMDNYSKNEQIQLRNFCIRGLRKSQKKLPEPQNRSDSDYCSQIDSPRSCNDDEIMGSRTDSMKYYYRRDTLSKNNCDFTKGFLSSSSKTNWRTQQPSTSFAERITSEDKDESSSEEKQDSFSESEEHRNRIYHARSFKLLNDDDNATTNVLKRFDTSKRKNGDVEKLNQLTSFANSISYLEKSNNPIEEKPTSIQEADVSKEEIKKCSKNVGQKPIAKLSSPKIASSTTDICSEIDQFCNDVTVKNVQEKQFETSTPNTLSSLKKSKQESISLDIEEALVNTTQLNKTSAIECCNVTKEKQLDNNTSGHVVVPIIEEEVQVCTDEVNKHNPQQEKAQLILSEISDISKESETNELEVINQIETENKCDKIIETPQVTHHDSDQSEAFTVKEVDSNSSYATNITALEILDRAPGNVNFVEEPKLEEASLATNINRNDQTEETLVEKEKTVLKDSEISNNACAEISENKKHTSGSDENQKQEKHSLTSSVKIQPTEQTVETTSENTSISKDFEDTREQNNHFDIVPLVNEDCKNTESSNNCCMKEENITENITEISNVDSLERISTKLFIQHSVPSLITIVNKVLEKFAQNCKILKNPPDTEIFTEKLRAKTKILDKAQHELLPQTEGDNGEIKDCKERIKVTNANLVENKYKGASVQSIESTVLIQPITTEVDPRNEKSIAAILKESVIKNSKELKLTSYSNKVKFSSPEITKTQQKPEIGSTLKKVENFITEMESQSLVQEENVPAEVAFYSSDLEKTNINYAVFREETKSEDTKTSFKNIKIENNDILDGPISVIKNRGENLSETTQPTETLNRKRKTQKKPRRLSTSINKLENTIPKEKSKPTTRNSAKEIIKIKFQKKTKGMKQTRVGKKKDINTTNKKHKKRDSSVSDTYPHDLIKMDEKLYEDKTLPLKKQILNMEIKNECQNVLLNKTEAISSEFRNESTSRKRKSLKKPRKLSIPIDQVDKLISNEKQKSLHTTKDTFTIKNEQKTKQPQKPKKVTRKRNSASFKKPVGRKSKNDKEKSLNLNNDALIMLAEFAVRRMEDNFDDCSRDSEGNLVIDDGMNQSESTPELTKHVESNAENSSFSNLIKPIEMRTENYSVNTNEQIAQHLPVKEVLTPENSITNIPELPELPPIFRFAFYGSKENEVSQYPNLQADIGADPKDIIISQSSFETKDMLKTCDTIIPKKRKTINSEKEKIDISIDFKDEICKNGETQQSKRLIESIVKKAADKKIAENNFHDIDAISAPSERRRNTVNLEKVQTAKNKNSSKRTKRKNSFTTRILRKPEETETKQMDNCEIVEVPTITIPSVTTAVNSKDKKSECKNYVPVICSPEEDKRKLPKKRREPRLLSLTSSEEDLPIIQNVTKQYDGFSSNVNKDLQICPINAFEKEIPHRKFNNEDLKPKSTDITLKDDIKQISHSIEKVFLNEKKEFTQELYLGAKTSRSNQTTFNKERRSRKKSVDHNEIIRNEITSIPELTITKIPKEVALSKSNKIYNERKGSTYEEKLTPDLTCTKINRRKSPRRHIQEIKNDIPAISTRRSRINSQIEDIALAENEKMMENVKDALKIHQENFENIAKIISRRSSKLSTQAEDIAITEGRIINQNTDDTQKNNNIPKMLSRRSSKHTTRVEDMKIKKDEILNENINGTQTVYEEEKIENIPKIITRRSSKCVAQANEIAIIEKSNDGTTLDEEKNENRLKIITRRASKHVTQTEDIEMEEKTNQSLSDSQNQIEEKNINIEEIKTESLKHVPLPEDVIFNKNENTLEKVNEKQNIYEENDESTAKIIKRRSSNHANKTEHITKNEKSIEKLDEIPSLDEENNETVLEINTRSPSKYPIDEGIKINEITIEKIDNRQNVCEQNTENITKITLRPSKPLTQENSIAIEEKMIEELNDVQTVHEEKHENIEEITTIQSRSKHASQAEGVNEKSIEKVNDPQCFNEEKYEPTAKINTRRSSKCVTQSEHIAEKEKTIQKLDDPQKIHEAEDDNTAKIITRRSSRHMALCEESVIKENERPAEIKKKSAFKKDHNYKPTEIAKCDERTTSVEEEIQVFDNVKENSITIANETVFKDKDILNTENKLDESGIGNKMEVGEFKETAKNIQNDNEVPVVDNFELTNNDLLQTNEQLIDCSKTVIKRRPSRSTSRKNSNNEQILEDVSSICTSVPNKPLETMKDYENSIQTKTVSYVNELNKEETRYGLEQEEISRDENEKENNSHYNINEIPSIITDNHDNICKVKLQEEVVEENIIIEKTICTQDTVANIQEDTITTGAKEIPIDDTENVEVNKNLNESDEKFQSVIVENTMHTINVPNERKMVEEITENASYASPYIPANIEEDPSAGENSSIKSKEQTYLESNEKEISLTLIKYATLSEENTQLESIKAVINESCIDLSKDTVTVSVEDHLLLNDIETVEVKCVTNVDLNEETAESLPTIQHESTIEDSANNTKTCLIGKDDEIIANAQFSNDNLPIEENECLKTDETENIKEINETVKDVPDVQSNLVKENVCTELTFPLTIDVQSNTEIEVINENFTEKTIQNVDCIQQYNTQSTNIEDSIIEEETKKCKQDYISVESTAIKEVSPIEILKETQTIENNQRELIQEEKVIKSETSVNENTNTCEENLSDKNENVSIKPIENTLEIKTHETTLKEKKSKRRVKPKLKHSIDSIISHSPPASPATDNLSENSNALPITTSTPLPSTDINIFKRDIKFRRFKSCVNLKRKLVEMSNKNKREDEPYIIKKVKFVEEQNDTNKEQSLSKKNVKTMEEPANMNAANEKIIDANVSSEIAKIQVSNIKESETQLPQPVTTTTPSSTTLVEEPDNMNAANEKIIDANVSSEIAKIQVSNIEESETQLPQPVTTTTPSSTTLVEEVDEPSETNDLLIENCINEIQNKTIAEESNSFINYEVTKILDATKIDQQNYSDISCVDLNLTVGSDNLNNQSAENFNTEEDNCANFGKLISPTSTPGEVPTETTVLNDYEWTEADQKSISEPSTSFQRVVEPEKEAEIPSNSDYRITDVLISNYAVPDTEPDAGSLNPDLSLNSNDLNQNSDIVFDPFDIFDIDLMEQVTVETEFFFINEDAETSQFSIANENSDNLQTADNELNVDEQQFLTNGVPDFNCPDAYNNAGENLIQENTVPENYFPTNNEVDTSQVYNNAESTNDFQNWDEPITATYDNSINYSNQFSMNTENAITDTDDQLNVDERQDIVINETCQNSLINDKTIETLENSIDKGLQSIEPEDTNSQNTLKASSTEEPKHSLAKSSPLIPKWHFKREDISKLSSFDILKLNLENFNIPEKPEGLTGVRGKPNKKFVASAHDTVEKPLKHSEIYRKLHKKSVPKSPPEVVEKPIGLTGRIKPGKRPIPTSTPRHSPTAKVTSVSSNTTSTSPSVSPPLLKQNSRQSNKKVTCKVKSCNYDMPAIDDDDDDRNGLPILEDQRQFKPHSSNQKSPKPTTDSQLKTNDEKFNELKKGTEAKLNKNDNSLIKLRSMKELLANPIDQRVPTPEPEIPILEHYDKQRQSTDSIISRKRKETTICSPSNNCEESPVSKKAKLSSQQHHKQVIDSPKSLAHSNELNEHRENNSYHRTISPSPTVTEFNTAYAAGRIDDPKVTDFLKNSKNYNPSIGSSHNRGGGSDSGYYSSKSTSSYSGEDLYFKTPTYPPESKDDHCSNKSKSQRIDDPKIAEQPRKNKIHYAAPEPSRPGNGTESTFRSKPQHYNETPVSFLKTNETPSYDYRSPMANLHEQESIYYNTRRKLQRGDDQKGSDHQGNRHRDHRKSDYTIPRHSYPPERPIPRDKPPHSQQKSHKHSSRNSTTTNPLHWLNPEVIHKPEKNKSQHDTFELSPDLMERVGIPRDVTF